MANKIIKTRIQHKHDYEVNWIKAVDFVPLKGEIIIYDAETEELFASQYADLTDEQKATIRRSEAITYVRTKIGNGVDTVTDLPFYSSNANENSNPDWNQNDEYQPDYIKNRTHYTDDDGEVHKLNAKYIPVDNDTIFIKETTNVISDAEAGLYAHGSNFTELLYAWDNICKNSLIDGGNDPTDYYLCDVNGGYNASYADIIGGVAGDLVIPENFKSRPVTEIYDLFCGNVVIPSTVTVIQNLGDYTKQYNGGAATTQPCYVETIYIKATTPPEIESRRLKVGCSRLSKIVVPKGCANAYKSATGWCDYAEIIVEGEIGGEPIHVLSANIPTPDDITITYDTKNKLSVKDSYKDDVDTYLSRLSETEQPEFMSKTLIAAKNYTDKQLSEFDFIKIVDSLPEEGYENKIYLVPVSVEVGFPTGAPGAYTAGGKFSNLEYTWDELITRESRPYVSLKAGDYADILTTDHDIIVSNNLEGADACPYDCNGKNIVLPESVTYIDNYQASAIGILYIKATTPPDLKSTFNVGIDKIVVPQGCSDAYKSETNWSNYEDIIVEAGDIVDTGDQNLFNEWIWINKNEGTDKEAEYVWEYVSTKSLDIDLTAYVKRTEMTAYVEEKLLTGTW